MIAQLSTKLADLQDLALIIEDRDLAERLLRVVGALLALNELHACDARGRCARCRPARRVAWRRQPCTVHDTLAAYHVGPPTLRRDA
jgi:hypothetical protein